MSDKKPKVVCRWLAMKKILVNPDGQVLPCCYMANPAYVNQVTKTSGTPGGRQFNNNPTLKKYMDNKEEYNLNHKTLEEILTTEWFNKDLPESWKEYSTIPTMCQTFCDNRINDDN